MNEHGQETLINELSCQLNNCRAANDTNVRWYQKEKQKFETAQIDLVTLRESHKELQRKYLQLDIAYTRLKSRMHGYNYISNPTQILNNLNHMSTPPLDRVPQPIEIYRDYIAGVQHGEYQLAEMANKLHVGDPLQLVWERTNKFDPNAIAIYTKTDARYRLGYIKAKDTNILHDLHNRGIKVSAFLLQYNPDEKPWNKLCVRVTAPNLIITTPDQDFPE